MGKAVPKTMFWITLFLIHCLAVSTATSSLDSFEPNPQRVHLRLKRSTIRTEDLIRKIGRGLLDPNVLSLFGPLLLAGLVALPFLAPTAILPLAGLMSSGRFGRRRRDLDESLSALVVKELPELLERLAKETMDRPLYGLKNWERSLFKDKMDLKDKETLVKEAVVSKDQDMALQPRSIHELTLRKPRKEPRIDNHKDVKQFIEVKV